MADFKRLGIEDVCRKLKNATYPVIITHCRPDADTIGSAVALAEIFSLMGKSAICICSDRLPPRLKFIDAKGVVKEDFTITTSNTIIAVDVAAPNQLGSFENTLSISMAIDHHAQGLPFSDNFICPEAAAAGEIIFSIAKRLLENRDIPQITRHMANALYAAISSDTGCFKYQNAAPATYRAAAELIELGAENDRINHLLFDCKDFRQLKAETVALDKTEFFGGGKIALSVITLKDREDAGIPESEFYESAIDVVRSVAGVEIAATLKETKKGEYRVSLRSMGRNVADIANKFGGGGHVRAAGCNIPAASVAEARAKLLAAIME